MILDVYAIVVVNSQFYSHAQLTVSDEALIWLSCIIIINAKKHYQILQDLGRVTSKRFNQNMFICFIYLFIFVFCHKHSGSNKISFKGKEKYKNKIDLLVEKKKYCHFESVSDSFFKNFLYLESFCSQVNYGVLDSLR